MSPTTVNSSHSIRRGSDELRSVLAGLTDGGEARAPLEAWLSALFTLRPSPEDQAAPPGDLKRGNIEELLLCQSRAPV